MLQADDEDDLLEERMRSPFGSSFRTFNATDYKPIGKRRANSLVWMFAGFLKALLSSIHLLLSFAYVTKQILHELSLMLKWVQASYISCSVCNCLKQFWLYFPLFFPSRA